MVVINDCAAVHSNTRIDKFSFNITRNEQNTRRISKTNIIWPDLRTMRTRRISVIDRAFSESGLNGQKDYFVMIAVRKMEPLVGLRFLRPHMASKLVVQFNVKFKPKLL